jgi:hypothetical protein
LSAVLNGLSADLGGCRLVVVFQNGSSYCRTAFGVLQRKFCNFLSHFPIYKNPS